jgi:putative phage-type endonuclease
VGASYSRVDLEQGTQEWLRWRGTVIGASDAPVIMGESPWKSRETLLREKISGRDFFQGNDATRRGQELEPVARRIYEGAQRVKVAPAVLVSALRVWQGASIDGLSLTGERVVEIKCGYKAYSILRETNRVPDYYYGQLQHILSVTGLPAIDYFSYIPNQPPLLQQVARDEQYIEALLIAEAEFWDAVRQGRSKLGGGHDEPGASFFGRRPSDGTKKISLSNGVVYEGDHVDGSAHGKGVMIWPDGSRYEGGFVAGARYGNGIYTWPDGTRHDGVWVEGKCHGEGSRVWADGRGYQGGWVDGIIHGKGVLCLADGSRYEGHFVAGELHGKGTRIWPDASRYDGDWICGKRTGKGMYTWPDGARHEGDWDDGKRHGKGLLTSADGSRYEGHFVADERHGKGIYSWPDGSRYDGDWWYGKRTGRGIYTWPDGARHEGDWVDGKCHGEGVRSWPDGRHYQGDWQQGAYHGRGVLALPDGGRYEGGFSAGRRQGHGTFAWPDGRRYEGPFLDDQLHGAGNLSSPRGWVLQGVWSGRDSVEGTLTWENGDVYIGHFVEKKADGQGKLTLVGGLSFSGVWENGLPSQNGEVYGSPAAQSGGSSAALAVRLAAVEEMRRRLREINTPRWKGFLLQRSVFGVDEVRAQARHVERAQFIRDFDKLLADLERILEEMDDGQDITCMGEIALDDIGRRSADMEEWESGDDSGLTPEGRKNLINAIAHQISVKNADRVRCESLAEVRAAADDFRGHCKQSPWKYLGERD